MVHGQTVSGEQDLLDSCTWSKGSVISSILQQTFFPPHFADATSSHRLKPGDTRMWTCMKVLIELRDGVTLQLPFREASKVNLCPGFKYMTQINILYAELAMGR